jgi:pyruvate dehydrogenase E1 component alpha subunit
MAKYTPQFMPNAKPVEPLRVLDENGKLLPGQAAPMTDEQAAYAIRVMMMGRGFDEKSFSLQRQGRLGTFAPVIGQEASTLGPAMALDPKRDWIAPQYRELPALLHMGLPFENVALYRLGRQAGACIPAGVHVLPHQISLAAQIPHAVGLGWGLKLQGRDGVSMAFFGDGASSEGDFHESCNLAGVMKAPVIFLLQDNGWAISTPRAIQTATVDFAARALGYGFPGIAVDGNDLFALYGATAEAVARARAGEGPTLVESRTFRMWAHTTADDPTRYVDPKVLAQWQKKDPIERVQKYLAAKGKWNDAMTQKIKDEVAAAVEKAYEFAFNYPPSRPEELFEQVFAEVTPQLARQRERHLASRS